MSAATLALACLTVAKFAAVPAPRLLIPVAAALAVLNLFNLGLALYWRRRPSRGRVPPRARWWIAADLALAGSLDAMLALQAFAAGDERQRLLL
ncbi:MAG: hypothetical protein ABW032_08450, partial [Burkholderiaceae bacterium]